MQVERLARKVVDVSPKATVLEAIRAMSAEEVSSVAVTEDSRLIGIFTLRDVARKVLLAGLDPATARMSAVMTTHPKWATGATEVRDALELMMAEHIHHLPIVDDEGLVVGLVSFQKLLRDKIMDLEDDVASLDAYIAVDGPGG